MESRVEERDYLGRSQEQSCLVLIQLVPLTGLNLHSNPAQDVRAVRTLCTSWSPQKMSLCQVWHFGCRQSETPPGMEWCCSVLLHLEILQNCPGSGVWNHELNLTVPLFPLGLALLIELGPFHRSHIWNQEHELLQLRLTWTSTFPAVVSVGTSPKTNCPYKISTSWDKIFFAKLLLYFSDVQYNSDPALAPGPKTSSHFRSITYQRAVIYTGYSGHC